ncbi:hypothetical protein HHI36_002021 [Cryptolaemus montrouzieri]|uniref:TIL domain-containing protein n=1 Tax=Cryptolaemus montrouzieri TaxID=559131 RepID=A0ABD2P9A7_9CUCU
MTEAAAESVGERTININANKNIKLWYCKEVKELADMKHFYLSQSENVFELIVLFIFSGQIYSTLADSSICQHSENKLYHNKTCDRTCEIQYPSCLYESPQLQPSCTCEHKYRVILTTSDPKTCVDPGHCPKTCSKPNFFWDDCGCRCPITCKYRKPRPCVEICQPGCYCKRGFILNEDTMECVKEEECPTKS